MAISFVQALPAICTVLAQQREVSIDDFALQLLVGFHTLPSDALAELVEVGTILS